MSQQNTSTPWMPLFRKLGTYLLKNHGWHVIFLSLLVYMVLNRDIRLELNMSSQPGLASSQVAPKAHKTALQELSLFQLFSPQKKEDHESEKKATKVKPAKNASEAPAFSNLIFILRPNIANEYAVDPALVQANRATCLHYLQRFMPVAIAEMKKFGIPASITLAQGLLESDAGVHPLSQKNHNHFGIKCFAQNCAKGHCSHFSNDGSHKDFYRKHANAWESYRAHSDLMQSKKYRHLLTLGTLDYEGWAEGLEKAGYATNPQYAEKLLRIIAAFELYKLDQ